MVKAFDNEKYLEEQTKFILERVNKHKKLYLEFGGKLVSDLHAKRILPGYDENVKIKLMQNLKDKLEIVICVNAGFIKSNKRSEDANITYDVDVLLKYDELTKHYGLEVNSVVITRCDIVQESVIAPLVKRLEERNIKVYKHNSIPNYPSAVDSIISDQGFGINPYIETSKPIVLVTAPGPGCGKLATCLNQLYHEYKKGVEASYSKFETFPVWNLQLNHPVNVSYEAATLDLDDKNMIDPFHNQEYSKIAVNYNRDIETFPLVKKIIEKITNAPSIYKSPTDMGVNVIKTGIIDDDAIANAGKQEIIRRYFKTVCANKKGYATGEMVKKSKMLMASFCLKEEDRIVVSPARNYCKVKNCIIATQVVSIADLSQEGKLVTGRTK